MTHSDRHALLSLTCFITLISFIGRLGVESGTTSILNDAVVKGGTYHLKCASANPVCGALQWLKRGLWGSEEAISYGRILMSNFGGRYAMNDSGVPCDVTVKDVQISDSGEFTCVSPDNGRQSAYLTVLDSAPRCWHDTNETEVLEGESINVYCSLEGYHTPGEAKLEWLDTHRQTVLTAAVTHRPGSINSTFIVVARSPAVYPFTCRTSFEFRLDQKLGGARNKPEISCTTKLIQVVYPVRDLRLRMNGTRLTPGKRVTCSADGEPRPSYHWITLTTGDIKHGDTVVIETGHVYQCIAFNIIRGRTYEEKSWEVAALGKKKDMDSQSSMSPVLPQSPSPSTAPITSLPLLLADQPEDLDIYNYDVKHDDDTNLDDVTPRIQIITKDNRITSISSIVLGVLLLISLVIILIILVHLCGLRDKLKEAEHNKCKQNEAAPISYNPAYYTKCQQSETKPLSYNPAHYATATAAREVMTPMEANGSTKSPLLANGVDHNHDDIISNDEPQPQIVGNWEIHGDVYVDLDSKT